jgi:hypothetical protein
MTQKNKKKLRTFITLVVLVAVERVVTRAPTTEDATDAAMQEDAGNIMEAIIYISRKLLKKNLRRWRTKRREIKSMSFLQMLKKCNTQGRRNKRWKKHRDRERERERA